VDRKTVCFKCRGAGHMIKDCGSQNWYEFDKYGELIQIERKDNENPKVTGTPPRSGAAPRY
jgi:hypothetical protein